MPGAWDRAVLPQRPPPRRSALLAVEFTYNHIGHFAAANHAACKAMFLGGVTRRFPGLNISFLEGGSGWAVMLYGDLLSHWEKRSRQGLEEVDPRNLDRAVLADLAGKYGSDAVRAAL